MAAHLLHAISHLPVIDERHDDLDALLGHLVQDEVNCLEDLLVILPCAVSALKSAQA